MWELRDPGSQARKEKTLEKFAWGREWEFQYDVVRVDSLSKNKLKERFGPRYPGEGKQETRNKSKRQETRDKKVPWLRVLALKYIPFVWIPSLPLTTWWPWANYYTSAILSFLTYVMGTELLLRISEIILLNCQMKKIKKEWTRLCFRVSSKCLVHDNHSVKMDIPFFPDSGNVAEQRRWPHCHRVKESGLGR
jgi:hypothetical protein